MYKLLISFAVTIEITFLDLIFRKSKNSGADAAKFQCIGGLCDLVLASTLRLSACFASPEARRL